MSLPIYNVLVPVALRGFENLSTILKKAESYAQTKKIDPSVLLNARLAPDMFALTRQVQIASDVVKGGAARLADVDVPSFADTETTFEELQARIAKTVDFLKSISPQHFSGSGSRSISLKVGGQELNFKGEDYLLKFVIPNFYFHTSIVYAILRHNGLDIGKRDFLGALT